MLTSSSLAIIEKRIADIKVELQEHPLYRELSILEKTRDKLRLLISAYTQPHGDVVRPQRPKDWRHRPRGGNAVTQLDGVELALEAAGWPLSTAELVAMLPRHGVTVGGKNPSVNLASVISKCGDRFQSVTWRGGRAWWFKGRSLPSPSNGTATTERGLWLPTHFVEMTDST